MRDSQRRKNVAARAASGDQQLQVSLLRRFRERKSDANINVIIISLIDIIGARPPAG